MDGMTPERPERAVPRRGIPWQAAVISDKPRWLGRLFGVRFKDGPRAYRMRWGEFSWKWGLAVDLINWEEDEDWSLHLQLIYGNAYIKLPFLPKRAPPSQEYLEHWGFSWDWDVDNRGADIHLHWGRRTKIVHLPWEYSHFRSEMLCADGVWREMKRDYDLKDGDEPAATETHPFRYVCGDGRIQNAKATIEVHEMEWRWKLARRLRLPWPRLVRRSIDVTFTSDEKDFDGIGERAGQSWKGGTIGCGYEMKPGEMPVDTLRRMQRERKFR